jgi:CRP/FNR family transcriptional regulator, cyclic AMP receptor protein
MATVDRAKQLKRIALLSEMAPADLERLAAACVWRDYEPDTDILTYQDGSTDVYFLVSGKARVMIYSAQGKAVVFTDLGAGELFGELSAIDGKPRSASVAAVDASTVASLSSAAFLKLIATQPTVSIGLTKSLVSDIRRMDERVLEFSTLNVPGRIQAELLRYADEASAHGPDSVLLKPGPSLADLSSRVSTHREAVSRELSRLAQEGLVAREGSDIRIVSRAKLRAMVQAAKGE